MESPAVIHFSGRELLIFRRLSNNETFVLFSLNARQTSTMSDGSIFFLFIRSQNTTAGFMMCSCAFFSLPFPLMCGGDSSSSSEKFPQSIKGNL